MLMILWVNIVIFNLCFLDESVCFWFMDFCFQSRHQWQYSSRSHPPSVVHETDMPGHLILCTSKRVFGITSINSESLNGFTLVHRKICALYKTCELLVFINLKVNHFCASLCTFSQLSSYSLTHFPIIRTLMTYSLYTSHIWQMNVCWFYISWIQNMYNRPFLTISGTFDSLKHF